MARLLLVSFTVFVAYTLWVIVVVAHGAGVAGSVSPGYQRTDGRPV